MPPGDADAIKEAFEKLAGNRTLMNEIGMRNRKTGLSNSWRKTAHKIRDLIVRVTDTPKKKSKFCRVLDRTILDRIQSYKINLLVQY